MCWKRYCTITLGWLEFSNAGFIVIANAEMDAKEDGEDKNEDKKNVGNKDVPATFLERKKRKRKNSTKAEEKEREGRKQQKPTTEFNHYWAFQ